MDNNTALVNDLRELSLLTADVRAECWELEVSIEELLTHENETIRRITMQQLETV
jgi:hypothetical protein